MKFAFCVGLCIASAVNLAAADSKQQTVEELFRRASEVTSPQTAMKGPYRIQYKLIFHGAATGPIEGSYLRIWLSHDQGRLEVSVPGFSEVEVYDGPSRFVSHKPHHFVPRIVDQMAGALGRIASVKLPRNVHISKISEKAGSKERLQCVETRQPDLPPSMGEETFCFDPSNGALVRVEEGKERTEYSDFENTQGALIPRKVQHFTGKNLDSEAALVGLTAQDQKAAAVLDHSADSRESHNCIGNITGGRLVVRANPIYPLAARRAHQTGTVEIYLLIDTAGMPEDIEIVRGASKLLDDAAIEAVSKWRYEPYECDGVPIEVDSDTTVNFSL